MNSAIVEPVTWSMRRWLILLALVFVSQLALIYLLSARKSASVRPQVTPSSIQLFTGRINESEFSETFLASDPTLFAIANLHGFSGSAWLKVPQRNYDSVQRATEAPFWLALNTDQLGKGVAQFTSTNAVAPLSNVEIPEPKILATLIVDPTNVSKTNSLLRVEGDLASRELINPPALQSWTHTNILSNSVVQIAVDRNGLAIPARLMSRSGLAEADRTALELARNISFVPSAGNEMTWGKLIFDWHMTPLAAAANSNNPILPLK